MSWSSKDTDSLPLTPLAGLPYSGLVPSLLLSCDPALGPKALWVSHATVSKATFLGVGPFLPRNQAPRPCATEIGLGAEAVETSSALATSVLTWTSFGSSLEGLEADSSKRLEADSSKLLLVVTMVLFVYYSTVLFRLGASRLCD